MSFKIKIIILQLGTKTFEMSFLDKHYDYVHTQSFKSMVDDITDYCHKKGGGLQ